MIFQDAYGKELYRHDYQENEIKDWGDVSLDIKYIGQSPSKWLMWGYTKENGWADSSTAHSTSIEYKVVFVLRTR